VEGRLLVSDFWIGQSMAYARCQSRRQGSLDAAYRRSRAGLGLPKLLVLLDVPYSCLSARLRARKVAAGWRLAPEQHRQVAAAIRREALKPGRGPTLVWSGSRLSDALAETVAAVEAMDEAGIV
jgi:hypothetical protein